MLCQIPSKTGGQPEKKEVLLEDHDPVWLELRHAHIADVNVMNLAFVFNPTYRRCFTPNWHIRLVSGCMRR